MQYPSSCGPSSCSDHRRSISKREKHGKGLEPSRHWLTYHQPATAFNSFFVVVHCIYSIIISLYNHFADSSICAFGQLFTMSDSPDPTPIALPVGEMSIDHYVALITSCLQGWTSLSVAVWNRLTDHRLTKVYHCKHTNSSSEHECVICEFVDELGNKLVLRMDRHVGAHRHTVDVGSSSISSPPSSRSLSSVNEKSSKASFSSLHGSISFPSDIISDRYLAKDTISRIQGHPPGYEALRTITFNGDRSLRPSLWDVAILVLVVHKDSPFYNLHARQCYWFADTIFAALEKWAVIRKNGTVMHDEAKQGRRRASTGSRRDVIVHRRKSEKIAKIWDDFEKKLDVMTQQVRICIWPLFAMLMMESRRSMSESERRRWRRRRGMPNK